MADEQILNPGLPIRYFEKPRRDSSKTTQRFEQKSEVDNKLGRSFYYLPHLDICKSQNVPVNIYCNFANELLCLLESLYRSNIDLFALPAVVWQHSQQCLLAVIGVAGKILGAIFARIFRAFACIFTKSTPLHPRFLKYCWQCPSVANI